MFFIVGMSSRQKKLEFNQTIVCSHCGQYGHLEVIMEYMFLSFFFLPIIKWNKKYIVQSTCCNSLYTINKELGNKINRGEDVTLTEDDLEVIRSGHRIKSCSFCGYETSEAFKYCPKCSKEF